MSAGVSWGNCEERFNSSNFTVTRATAKIANMTPIGMRILGNIGQNALNGIRFVFSVSEVA